jgi:hypothetical protein
MGVVMCEVIHITNHYPGTRPYDIYIGYAASWGEAGKWGNQFDVAGDLFQIAKREQAGHPDNDDILDVDLAVRLYKHWLLYTPAGLRLQEDIDELRGKVLGCFCKPHPCHGDVLVELLGQREDMDANP